MSLFSKTRVPDVHLTVQWHLRG